MACACLLFTLYINAEASSLSKLHGSMRLENKSGMQLKSGSQSLIVRCDDPDVIDQAGASIISYENGIAIISADNAALSELMDNDAVKSIRRPRRLKAYNNLSRQSSALEPVHSGTGLPKAFRGEGVIAGIFDIGFDPNHINFRAADGSTRFDRFFHFISDDGTYNTLCSSDIPAFTTDSPSMTHATHTLGTLAGSYDGEVIMPGANGTTVTAPCPYMGYMPEATIAAAGGELYDANIMAGCAAIADYAASEGKPCVINLSLGTLLGPRDGTDEETAFLNSLSDRAIIVTAAGNDGAYQLSFSHTFTEAAPVYRTFLRPWDPVERHYGVVDVWGGPAADLRLTIAVVDYFTGEIYSTIPVTPDEDGIFIISTNPAEGYADPAFASQFTDSHVAIAFSTNERTNNRPNYWIDFSLMPSAANPETNRSVALWIEGPEGTRADGGSECENFRFHAGRNPGYHSPIAEFTISSMACGPDMVCAGSYDTRNSWENLCGGSHSYSNSVTGDVSYFSSNGVLYDGRELPHVVAPGEWVFSSYSDFCDEERDEDVARFQEPGRMNRWNYECGTSMATPAVAGAIGLWLQACPSLTAEQVHQIIEASSVKDDFYQADRNKVRWGAGKLNVLEGLKMALNIGAGISGNTVPDANGITVYRNGSTLNVLSTGAVLEYVEIYDLSGRIIMRTDCPAPTAELDASSLNAGMYLLRSGAGTAKVVI